MDLPPKKIAPSGDVKGQFGLQRSPSHLPEPPSAGIGTLLAVSYQRSAIRKSKEVGLLTADG
jgi:hypothetical protein